MKTLFWISVSNFVFPVILKVVQVVLILGDAEFALGTLVLMANNYITIIGVLLATLWCSEAYWERRAPGPRAGSGSGEKQGWVGEGARGTHSLPSAVFAGASTGTSETTHLGSEGATRC